MIDLRLQAVSEKQKHEYSLLLKLIDTLSAKEVMKRIESIVPDVKDYSIQPHTQPAAIKSTNLFSREVRECNEDYGYVNSNRIAGKPDKSSSYHTLGKTDRNEG